MRHRQYPGQLELIGSNRVRATTCIANPCTLSTSGRQGHRHLQTPGTCKLWPAGISGSSVAAPGCTAGVVAAQNRLKSCAGPPACPCVSGPPLKWSHTESMCGHIEDTGKVLGWNPHVVLAGSSLSHTPKLVTTSVGREFCAICSAISKAP